jgi:hypothetical protein
MAVRAYPGGAANGVVTKNGGVSTATTGNKVQYTCPAGFGAVVKGVTVVPTAGAATVQVQLVLSGSTVIVAQSTTGIALAVQHNLVAGDTVRVNVSVADAGGVIDSVISADEYPVV